MKGVAHAPLRTRLSPTGSESCNSESSNPNQRHVTSCPQSPESKSLSRPPSAREKPPEPQTPASRRARSLLRPNRARAFSALRSHAGRSATPLLSLPPPYAPARNDLPPASCGSPLPSACAQDPATAHAHLPERQPHPPPELRCDRPVQEPPPRPAPPKRTHTPPLVHASFLPSRRKVPVPIKVPSVPVEDTARPAAPVSCPPLPCPPTLVPAPAPRRLAGTKYSNRARSFPAIHAPAGAGPPVEAPAAAQRQVPVETRLAASHRPRPPPEPPDARVPNAPPRPARFPPTHPCVRSRPRQILPRSSAAADAARDYEGRQYPDSTNLPANSAAARAEIPAMQRGGSPAAAAPTRQTRVPAPQRRFADERPKVPECRYRERCAAAPSPPDR